MISEADDEEEVDLGSSPGNSLTGSMAIIEKVESEPDDRNLAMSESFDFIEHEASGSADEDGFVHVPRSRPS